MQPKAIATSKESKCNTSLTDISKIEWVCDREWTNWEFSVQIDQSFYLICLSIHPSIYFLFYFTLLFYFTSYFSCLYFSPWKFITLMTLGVSGGRFDYRAIIWETRGAMKKNPYSFNYGDNYFVFISYLLNYCTGEVRRPGACH